MKLKLLLSMSLLVSTAFGAQVQNLQDILDSLNQSQKVNTIKEKTASQIAQNELSVSYEAPELGVSIAHAKDSAQEGAEYSFVYSQKLLHPFSFNAKNRGSEFLSKSFEQESKHTIHLLRLEVISKYYTACISKEMQYKAESLLTEQNKRFSQLQRAHNLGEISKKDLLFNKLELLKLNKKASAYKKEFLLMLSKLQGSADSLNIENLACNDLLAPTQQIELGELDAHSELQNLEYQKKSSEAFYKVYDSTFQSLAYEVGYDKELDTQRYSFGVTIPITSLTSSKEKAKAQYMHTNSALKSEKEALKQEISNSSKSMQLKIKVLYDEYILLNEEVIPLSQELAKLSKSAFDEGEANIMEYVDSIRSLWENELEMLEIKQQYYNQLFELYKIADLDLGEK